MMTQTQPGLVRASRQVLLPFALIAYGSLHSGALVQRWLGMAGGSFELWIFAVWLMPVAFLWRSGAENDLSALCAGAILSMSGVLGSADVLIYFGLATSIAALLPFSTAKLLWILSATSWMTNLSFGLPQLSPDGALWCRMGLALLGITFFAWGLVLRESPGSSDPR